MNDDDLPEGWEDYHDECDDDDDATVAVFAGLVVVAAGVVAYLVAILWQ